MPTRSYDLTDFEKARDLLDACIEQAELSKKKTPGPGPGLGNIDNFVRDLKAAKSLDVNPQNPDTMDQLLEAFHLSNGHPMPFTWQRCRRGTG